MIHYTYAERTVKKHTIHDAINQALAVLKEKKIGNQVCTDQLKGRDYDEKITVKEMSDIVDELVMDTMYWETGSIFGVQP